MGLIYSTNKTSSSTTPETPVVKEEQFTFEDTTTPLTPHNKRIYGGREAPVAMTVGKLDSDLQDYLLSQKIFACNTPEEYKEHGFTKCVDYPGLHRHVYYEGYFHSQTSSNSIPSINPRNGCGHDKPAAPPAIRAFYKVFRDKNREALQEISDNISKLNVDTLMAPSPSSSQPTSSSSSSTSSSEEIQKRRAEQRAAEIERNRSAIETFADLFDQKEGAQFAELAVADLAVQVHYGQGVHHNLGWHFDNVNSLFHLATSIHGRRGLYSRLADKLTDCTGDFDVHVDHLEKGDVYVSSPHLFAHSVQYPEQTWEDRTIAIQARFLLTKDVKDNIYRVAEEVRFAVAACVSDVVERGMKYPSLSEVQAMESTL